MLSATVRQGNSVSRWKMYPTLGVALPATTGTPSIRIWPLLGLINVAIMLRMVLLPEPDGPSRATNSPRRMLKETSRTASMAAPASWNVLLNPLTSMRAASGDRCNGIPETFCASNVCTSARIRFSRRLDEARADDVGDGERLDARHLAEPDLAAACKTIRIDGAVVVGNFFQRSDFQDVGAARRAADIRLDHLIDLIGRMRL